MLPQYLKKINKEFKLDGADVDRDFRDRFGEIIEIEIYEIILGIFLIQTGYVLDYGTDHIKGKDNINPLE